MEKITYEGFDYIIINDHNNPFYGRESVYSDDPYPLKYKQFKIIDDEKSPIGQDKQ